MESVISTPASAIATPSVPSIPPPAPARLVSLDAYRGFIMLTLLCSAMFSRNLGSVPGLEWLVWNNAHSEWAIDVFGNPGVPYWDLIQPSFMFMVGVAMPFALAKRLAAGASQKQIFIHVLIRAFNLTMVGIVLDHMGATKIQPGFVRVLQQIALAYVPASFLVGKSFRAQAITAFAILAGYQLLWMFNPWNGAGGPWAQSHDNIGSALDYLLRERSYKDHYVGMNAIPSTATIIFGVMAGTLIQKRLSHTRTFFVLLAAGLVLGGAGVGLSIWFPIIKIIWTPTWTLFAAGCTTLILATFFLVIDIWGLRRWAFFLVVVGMNSIVAYCLPDFLHKGVWEERLSKPWLKFVNEKWIQWPANSPWQPVFERSLFVLFAWLILYWLWRRRIFIKC